MNADKKVKGYMILTSFATSREGYLSGVPPRHLSFHFVSISLAPRRILGRERERWWLENEEERSTIYMPPLQYTHRVQKGNRK
jgi:hypothetical protein